MELYDRRGKDHSVMMPVIALLFVAVGLGGAWLFWQSQQPAPRSSLSNEEYVRMITEGERKSVPYGSVQGIVSRSQPVPVAVGGAASEKESKQASASELEVADVKPLQKQSEKATASAAATKPKASGKTELATNVAKEKPAGKTVPQVVVKRGKADEPEASRQTRAADKPEPEKKVAAKQSEAKKLSTRSKPVPKALTPRQVAKVKPVAEPKPLEPQLVEVQPLKGEEKERVERDYSLFTVDAVFVTPPATPVSRSEQRCLAAREKLEDIKAQMHTDYEPDEYRTLINQQIRYNRQVKKYCF